MSELIHFEVPRADFFVMGDESLLKNLDLNFIPRAEFVEPGTIKFGLIGLAPCVVEENVLENYIKFCLNKGTKPVCVVLPVNAAVRKTYDADVVQFFRDKINKVVRKHKAIFVDLFDIDLPENLFQDKSHLNEEGKAAVSALLSERLYFRNIISPMDILGAGEDFFNVLEKYFANERLFWSDDIPLPHHIFAKMACEDFNRLSVTLPRKTCMDLMARVFSELPHSCLASLSGILPKDDYNELMTCIFDIIVENIRRKDKIKVGFYFEYSSHWCGDDLYNLLAKDERFEPAIFIPKYKYTEYDSNEFTNDAKKFKERGFNVLETELSSSDIPKQDILFRFFPYPEFVPPAFRLTNFKVKETLLLYIPYSFFVVVGGSNYPQINVLYKYFFPSTSMLETNKKWHKLGMPRGVYSGYPKLDVFFKSDTKFQFDWKMTRPDAKKIIWAPHHSIGCGTCTATFQWNYRFMYEFAKAHPETSWVVKPHSNLFRQAIWSGVFPSDKAMREYFQKWDELPNARFYTGTYYQDIFATSDGMIQDCCSFVAEYQYVDKPMIYLTRQGSVKFDELGNEILKASYLVDGKDLEGIAALMQRVFIEGDDYKAAERKEVFDKYLNYPKTNGMLASEFIYKNICDELKLPPR